MPGRPKAWTPETEQWLLTTAWKRMTLQEIADYIDANASVINRLYIDNDIKPITKRDRVASKVLDLYNSTEQPPTNKELAKICDCSQGLIKMVIEEYNLTKPIVKEAKPVKKKDSVISANLKALQEREQRIAEQNKLRAQYAVYTQGSSELLDSVRQIRTSVRPKTLLTNG